MLSCYSLPSSQTLPLNSNPILFQILHEYMARVGWLSDCPITSVVASPFPRFQSSLSIRSSPRPHIFVFPVYGRHLEALLSSLPCAKVRELYELDGPQFSTNLIKIVVKYCLALRTASGKAEHLLPVSLLHGRLKALSFYSYRRVSMYSALNF
jgi:hypothetical protein